MRVALGFFMTLSIFLGTMDVSAKENLFVEKAKNNHCYECHRDNEQFIGPSFMKIKERYQDQANNHQFIDYLAKKIITGGRGAWGPTPMNSHPDMAMADAKEMVKLLFKLQSQ
jgi:cytochrome c